MVPLPLIIRSFSSRSKYNKAKANGHFNAKIPEGRPGVITMIPDEDALDIAFVSVLTRRGFSPEDAKLKSADWLTRIKDGLGLHPYQVFQGSGMIGTTAAGLRGAIEHLADQADMPDGAEFRPSTGIVIINTDEIRARIQAWSDYMRDNDMA